MSPLSNLQQRDIETLIHPYTNLDAVRHSGPTIIERARTPFAVGPSVPWSSSWAATAMDRRCRSSRP